jgi:hypothetical protein
MAKKKEKIIDEDVFMDTITSEMRGMVKEIETLTYQVGLYSDLLNQIEKDKEKYVLQYQIDEEGMTYNRKAKKVIGF